MINDLRYAARALMRAPGFAIIAVLTLALGIGATTTIFSAVRAVVLRPLPYPEPGELAQVFTIWRGNESSAHSPPNFFDLRAQNSTFAELAAFAEQGLALTGEGNAEQVPSAAVTGGFFAVLGTRPQLGRGLTLADAEPGAARTVVLGAGLWRRRFASDAGIIGRRILIDGNSHEVVGVMPESFRYPLSSEMWVPLPFSASELATQRGAYYIHVVGRLRPGVTVERARGDVAAIAQRLAEQYPNSNADVGATAHSLHAALTGNVKTPMLVLLGAVGLVLLIACVNVANLLLVRGVSRARELAVRAALGANAGRLVRAQLAESLLLAIAGGGAGMLVAAWGGSLIQGVTAANIPFLGQTRLDAQVLLFAALVTVGTGLLFGLFPAWQVSRMTRLASRLREESGASIGDRGRHRVRHGLVIAELALATMLLVGSGLLVRSLYQMSRVELGLEPSGVMTFHVNLPDSRYPAIAQTRQFTQSALERLRALPGVRSAGATFGMPMTRFSYGISGLQRDGQELDEAEQTRTSVAVRAVTPGFFETMGMRLVSGRMLAETDGPGSPEVIVVNESAARLIWPGEPNVVGRSFVIGSRMIGGDGPRAGGEVIGVVADVHERGPAVPPLPTIYLSLAHRPLGYLAFALRTTGDPTALTEPMRRAIAEIDPSLPLFRVRSAEQLASDVVAQPRLYAGLLAIFAAVAVTLASIGVYGVIAYGVRSRTREIGVRVALGASRANMMRSIVGQGTLLATGGVAIGLVGAYAASRVISGLLFGVQPVDAPTYAFVALALLFVAVLASWIPARRAARVDPMVALRAE